MIIRIPLAQDTLLEESIVVSMERPIGKSKKKKKSNGETIIVST